MDRKEFITIPELARHLGVSRITVYNRVKKGLIPAKMVGKTYIITDKATMDVLGKKLTTSKRKKINEAVDKAVREYGNVLKQLSRE